MGDRNFAQKESKLLKPIMELMKDMYICSRVKVNFETFYGLLANRTVFNGIDDYEFNATKNLTK